MPFIVPMFGNATGDRAGSTGLAGRLAPGIDLDNGNIALGANISAYFPFGAITTKVSAGFEAGLPPYNASTLFVSVSGMAPICRGGALTLFGYAYAHADLSITIEEWTALARPRSTPRLVNSFICNPIQIFDVTATVLGVPTATLDNSPFSCAFSMPIRPDRYYVCWINVSQSATCQGVVYAEGDSNVVFEFPNVFFDFTNP
jgi:hypothetical protein